jgi:succinate dehydrogenase / fumarate reductase membrane anchor subunit
VKRTVSGLRAWLLQRLSAVVMLAFIVSALLRWWVAPPQSYAQWHDSMRHPPVIVACCLFFGALLLHSWIGVRDVLMDYVHPVALRLGLLTLLGLGLLAMGLWVLRILL